MAIKAVIFDLDNTLTSTGDIHFKALNQALHDLNPEFCFSKEEDTRYLGTMTTRNKLAIICKLKNIDPSLFESIIFKKIYYTTKIIEALPVSEYFSPNTLQVIESIKSKGIKTYVASNTNKAFIETILTRTGMTFDGIYTNSDVVNPKPNPEMYLRAFIDAGISPDEALIVEDSITGQKAALKSGAHLFPVESPADLIKQDIMLAIEQCSTKRTPWHSRKIHIVIPMAGEGNRFKAAGFKTPKPLIDVRGLPMFAAVLRDLNIDAKISFIVKDTHESEYHISTMLKLASPGCNIHYVSGKQEGAATTILQIKESINNSDHLIISNADNMWDWNAKVFYQTLNQDIDGSIVVFEDKKRDPRWSFAKVENNYVVEVAEKNPISDWATAGIYAFNKGSDFVKYAEQMVRNQEKVNGEYYVCPVYNQMIKDNKKITIFPIDQFWPTGTPEELEFYLANRPEKNVQ